jgi:hypothetical protein
MNRSWTVVGALTGLVVCPALVALTVLLVHVAGGPVFGDQEVPALLLVSTAVGIAAGAVLTSRVVRVESPRRLAILGSISVAVLGATVMGSLFLFVEVMGDDWPQGLSAFVTGAILGAVLGGFLGGVIGFVQGGERGTTPAPTSTRHVTTSLRDVR